MRKLELRLGRYDDPARQQQPEYTADLYAGHLAVFGQIGKGKATALHHIVLQLHLLQHTQPEEIYILSYNNRLPQLADLPLVAACMDGSDLENSRRIFRLLGEKLARHRRLLPAGHQFAELPDPTAKVPHITFIIEGADKLYNTDTPQCQALQDELTRFAREGLACGLSLVLSADAPTGGLERLMGNNFQYRIAYTLTDREQYAKLFPGRVSEPLPLPGRGLALLGRETYEFQSYLPWPDDRQRSEVLQRAEQYFAQSIAYRPQKLCLLTGELTETSWPQFCPEPVRLPGWLTVGLDYERVEPLRIDLAEAGSILITGKKHSGKTNLLRAIVSAALDIPGCEFVFFEDGRNKLDELNSLFEDRAQPQVVRSFEALLQRVTGTDTVPQQGGPAVAAPISFADLLTGEPLLPADPAPAAVLPADPVPAAADAPFTVFVIQNNRFYLDAMQAELLSRSFQTAAENRQLFVFADAKPHGPAAAQLLNWQVNHLFVLDDLVRFCTNTRAGRFADMDQRELKEQYGTGSFCAGDGYYLDADGDEPLKLKLLRHPHT